MPVKLTPQNINQRSLYAGPAINTIPVISGPLIDTGNGVKVGSTCFCIGRVFTAAATAYAFPHKLGRVPTTIRHCLSRAGGVVYATTADMTAWTVNSVTLRCTLADTADFEVL